MTKTDISGNPACWPTYNTSPPPWSRAYSFIPRTSCPPPPTQQPPSSNDANLTKKQKWSQIARGVSHHKKKSWATQTDTATNPNIQGLKPVSENMQYILSYPCSQKSS